MSQHLMTEVHFSQIETAPDHHALLAVATDILALLDDPVGMVCGPISTGGLGCIEANKQRFTDAIFHLQGLGHIIFNQMPFESGLARLNTHTAFSYDLRILELFYRPIFESGRIKTKFFIPGWESSTGARWERRLAEELNIRIVDLDTALCPT